MIRLIAETALTYIIVNIAMRFMGKRQVGELSTSEIIVALLISEIAVAPIGNDEVPLWHGITAVFVLVAMEILYSYLSIKFPFFMQLTQGRPTVVIENGKICEKALLRNRLTIAELNEELRMKNISIRDVYMAIIENNGQLSIIPTNEASGVTRGDLNISVKEAPIDFAVIIDGQILEDNLKRAKQTMKFVRKYLQSKGVSSEKEVLALYADYNGVTYFQKKEKSPSGKHFKRKHNAVRRGK